MNNQLILATVVIVTVVLSFGVFQMSGVSIIVAQENEENGNMTDNTETNMTEMTEELSIQGEILHNR
ncbi:MAG: hypothetical protein ACE5SW_12290 [Nitrososphaeraceae archaeon]